MIVAAARRFAILALSLGLGTVAIGALFGVASGGSALRGAAVGLYAVGALSTVVGAGLAFRNSLQRFRPGQADAERTETSLVDRELAGVLIVVGLLLVVVGIAIDPGAQLV